MSGNNDANKTNRSLFPDGNALPVQETAGVVRVHESVIAAIVRKTALSVSGVSRLAGNSLVNNLAEIVGSKKIADRSILIEMGENSVKIELRIVAFFGFYLPDMIKNIQESVVSAIHEMTGMEVERFDVVIMDLEEDEEESSSDEKEEA